MLGVDFGVIKGNFNWRLGVWQDETPNEPLWGKASLFSTNVSKEGKDSFNFESSNSICKYCFNKKSWLDCFHFFSIAFVKNLVPISLWIQIAYLTHLGRRIPFLWDYSSIWTQLFRWLIPFVQDLHTPTCKGGFCWDLVYKSILVYLYQMQNTACNGVISSTRLKGQKTSPPEKICEPGFSSGGTFFVPTKSSLL